MASNLGGPFNPGWPSGGIRPLPGNSENSPGVSRSRVVPLSAGGKDEGLAHGSSQPAPSSADAEANPNPNPSGSPNSSADLGRSAVAGADSSISIEEAGDAHLRELAAACLRSGLFEPMVVRNFLLGLQRTMERRARSRNELALAKGNDGLVRAGDTLREIADGALRKALELGPNSPDETGANPSLAARVAAINAEALRHLSRGPAQRRVEDEAQGHLASATQPNARTGLEPGQTLPISRTSAAKSAGKPSGFVEIPRSRIKRLAANVTIDVGEYTHMGILEDDILEDVKRHLASEIARELMDRLFAFSKVEVRETVRQAGLPYRRSYHALIEIIVPPTPLHTYGDPE
jgi:hypothetical protein